MVVDDGGARFTCLAIARYTVAVVVTVLAIVFIVMVITVEILRPEKTSLSVVRGYLDAIEVVHRESVPARAKAAGNSGSKLHLLTATTVTNVSFWVNLRVENPGGRANIHCTNVTIRVLDMPYGKDNTTGMTVIGELNKPELGFLVKKKSSHMLLEWATMNDTRVMSYFSSKYGGMRSFTAGVHVAMSVSSDTMVVPAWTSPRNVHYYCWPLLVIVTIYGESSDSTDTTADEVTCIQSDAKYPIF